MKDEKAGFSARLRAALKHANIEASAAALERLFNSRYEGTPVTTQAISQWLNGRVMPRQDKVRVLAALVGLEPHVLQFGSKVRIGEEKALPWVESLGPTERAMLDAFMALPLPQRKLVHELILALSRNRTATA